MRLPGNQYDFIENEVCKVLSYCKVSRVPIDPFAIINCFPEIILVPYSSFNESQRDIFKKYSNDGFSMEKNHRWYIYYNDMHPCKERIKQTLMHEFAHFHLGHKILEIGVVDEILESEAKYFAKYILAPTPLIGILLEDTTELSIKKTFNISYEASSIAMSNYMKRWLYGSKNYKNYELKIIEQFNVA